MRIPLTEVVRLPLPGMATPSRFAFAPDGRHVTFLMPPGEGTLVQALWAADLETGARRCVAEPPGGGVREGALSLEEQLRRERLRERALGVTTYAWAGDRIVVPLAGEVWVKDGLDAPLRRWVDRPAIDPRASPDGRRLAFVRDEELHVAEADGTVRQVTTGARGTGRTHGLAEYVAQEEMKRQEGFWWAPDGALLAFTEVDETHVPVWRIVHEGEATPTWEDHRYPFAGAENAKVALWVVPSAGGAAVRIELPPFEYLARVAWLDARTLLVVLQDRRQQELVFLRADAGSGRAEPFLVERSDAWIGLHEVCKPLQRRPGTFVWASSRTGFRHLALGSADGTLAPITSGEWVVDELCAVDEEHGQVWFLGSRDGVLERHLYVAPLDGGEPVRLTAEPGFHAAVVDPTRGRYLDAWSTRDRPLRVVARTLEGGAVALHETSDPRIEALGVRPPELLSFRQRDGVELHGALWRPDGPGPFPLVVIVYGGPGVQRVADRWDTTADLRAQHLREAGFAVWKLDNRGSDRRGTAFVAPIRMETGRVEVADQVDGVAFLVGRGIADPARVGITGWSYGGYVTLMALCTAPDVFRAGVAGAPVTHWDGYDTHYTERYMGLPQENAPGYARSSVMAHVAGLRGGLMLVHGLLDENVHFRHTARLVNALVAHRKDFVLQLFPDERHTPRGEADRLYMEERIVAFLVRGLG